jgi:hypothetical protein
MAAYEIVAWAVCFCKDGLKMQNRPSTEKVGTIDRPTRHFEGQVAFGNLPEQSSSEDQGVRLRLPAKKQGSEPSVRKRKYIKYDSSESISNPRNRMSRRSASRAVYEKVHCL